jgi:hypothetical protein
MTHLTCFAKVVDGIVIEVIVADQKFIDKLDNPKEWIKTSYETIGGLNKNGIPLRKNYAGIGYTFDKIRDAFIPPKPFNSWILDENTCLWNSPNPRPTDNNDYEWNEDLLKWVIMEYK